MATGSSTRGGTDADRHSWALGMVILCTLFGGVLVLVILLPLSFKSVEYYQYGILRRASTGKVLLRRGIFGPGTRKMVGPDYNFKKFQADAHIASYERLSVFSGDRLECLLNLDVIYYINKTQLLTLHNTYERQYRPVVEGRIMDAVKNTAPKFSTNKFFTARAEVQEALFSAVKERLREVFMDVESLNLHLVKIPEEVAARQLRTAVQLETNIKEQYNANATQIRQETLKTVNTINNNATLVQQGASARATIILAKASTEAKRIVDAAQEAGLAYMYTQLNITSAEHKASLDYIRTLRTSGAASLNVGYSTKISTFDSATAAGPSA